MDEELPCEPAGHGEIATGSVSSCSPSWRSFVRSHVAMHWIEDNYRLLWAIEAPRLGERQNSSSVSEYRELVSNRVAQMVMADGCRGPDSKVPSGKKKMKIR